MEYRNQITYTALLWLAFLFMTACFMSPESPYASCDAALSNMISAETLCLEGEINPATYEFVQSNIHEVENVHINSGGGHVESALKIGIKIARLDKKVYIGDQCLSACAHFLLHSGLSLQIKESSNLGVHNRLNLLSTTFHLDDCNNEDIDPHLCETISKVLEEKRDRLRQDWDELLSLRPKTSASLKALEQAITINQDHVDRFLSSGGDEIDIWFEFEKTDVLNMNSEIKVIEEKPYVAKRCEMHLGRLYLSAETCAEILE